MKKWRMYLFRALGFFFLGLGIVGAAVPLLPSFIFFLLAALSFSKASPKLGAWFRSTKWYRENLEDYLSGRGMTRKAKIRLMITLTLMMSVGFVIMGSRGIYVGVIVLSIVWLGHILYFLFGIKTRPEEA
ncbi:MAG: YbaN family protein [Tissierellia bacterium]|nr:YbaN family protein [Tissierellia bacterium]